MFYYGIALIVLLLLNFLLVPNLSNKKIEEVGYGTFLQMLRDGDIKEIEVDYEDGVVTFGDNQEPENYYKAGLMEDPRLVDRLEEAGFTIISKSKPVISPFNVVIILFSFRYFLNSFSNFLTRCMNHFKLIL